MSITRRWAGRRLAYLGALVAVAAVAVFGGLTSQPAEQASAASPGFGNNLGPATWVYGAGNGRISVDLNTSAPHAGLITTFHYRREAGGVGNSFRFLLFEDVGGVLTVRYVGPLITVPVGGDGPVDVPVPGGVAVQAGWYLGVYSPGAAAIPHRLVGGALLRFTVTGMGTPVVGQTPFVSSQAGTSPIAAEGAIAASYGCGLTCYVDAITGDDTNNHGTSPTDAFKTIGKGVDTVQAGGTVIVAAGAYAEGVVINKPVTVRGPNFGRAGYQARLPEALVDGQTNIENAFFIFDTNGVVLDGLKINAAFNCVLAQGVQNLTVRNSIIEHCNDFGVGFDALGPYPFGVNTGLISRNLFGAADFEKVMITGSSNITISDNEFTGGLGGAILVDPGVITMSSNISILRNSIHDSPCLGCDAQVVLVNVLGGLIAENEIAGSPGLVTGSRIPLMFAGGNSNILVRNNILKPEGVLYAIEVVATFGVNSGLSFAFNDLSVGGVGVAPGAHAGTLMLERNWWGDVDGPDFNDGGPGAGTDIDSPSPVDFTPWLCKGVDQALGAIGFQPRWLSIYDGSPCDTTKPQWVVSYKTSGFPSTAYTPGAPGLWSRQPVIIEFTCKDTGLIQSPIQIAGGVKQIALSDGVWTNGNIPWTEGPLKGDTLAERCQDYAGNIADPVPAIGLGLSIRVDTKAPVCQPTVTSYYLPKNTIGYVLIIPIDGTETGSGIDFGTSTIVTSTSGGITVIGPLTTFVLGPPLKARVVMNTPNVSFASLTVAVTLRDFAGNVASCPTLTFYTSW